VSREEEEGRRGGRGIEAKEEEEDE